VWWRVDKTEGDHALAWNALRTFGPLLRFDPHDLPEARAPTAASGTGPRHRMRLWPRPSRSPPPPPPPATART
jgi:hypothetical protein